MPSLLTPTLVRRGASPGRTFSIIFAAVAFLVISACLVLVIILPRFRKKSTTLPGSRYPVVPNYPHPFGPPPRFPSHPALLRGFQKKAADPVQRYNPRVESPFPSSPTELEITRGPVNSGNHHHGIRARPQRGFMRRQDQVPTRLKLQAKGSTGGPDPRYFTAFSAKHEFILPVPEPLVLKARPAGRPPPLSRQLERFPMPLPLSSSRSRGLVHPVKLFKELERNSDTTIETLGTPCPAPQRPKQLPSIQRSLTGTVPSRPGPCQNGSTGSNQPNRTSPAFEFGQALPAPALPHSKLDEAKSSKTSDRAKQQGLQRMGTLTRPKTPVAEIRSWFDRAASDANLEISASSGRLHTPATNPFTTPGLSSSPPTTPGFSAEKAPIPLTPSRSSMAQQSRHLQSPARRRTPSSVTLPSPEKLTALPFASPGKRAHRAGTRSSQLKAVKKRSNTGRLKLVSWAKLRPSVPMSGRYSSSSLSTVFKPILGTRSQYSQGASSVYSRDARLLTFLEAIDLPTKSMASPQLEPAWSSERPAIRRSALHHKHSASSDHLQIKIDNWDLHTSNLDKPIFSAAAVKRSISDTGPRRAPGQRCVAPNADNSTRATFLPVVQIGRSSDDMFGIEADGFRSDRASILMKRMTPVGASSAVVARLGRAPGGGGWI